VHKKAKRRKREDARGRWATSEVNKTARSTRQKKENLGRTWKQGERALGYVRVSGGNSEAASARGGSSEKKKN
jgi:hypothetical protein